MQMNVEMKFTTLRNGFHCYYQHWFPENPRALLVMVHGLGDHIGRYNELVSMLSCNGFACALYDQRGFGLSEGKKGHFVSFERLLSDLDCFIDFSTARLSMDIPMFLVGGSLGGLICLNYLINCDRRLAGMILAAPAIRPAVVIPEWQRKAAHFLGKVVPSVCVDNRLDFDSMTRDPDEKAALISDRIFHRRISIGSAVEIEGRLKIVMAIPLRIRIPTLFLGGLADPICLTDGTRQFYNMISYSDKQMIVYENMLHDVLHDIGRKRVMEDILRWLTAHS
jgi:alpha-beta hydrolase superfamily lysophospholipase